MLVSRVWSMLKEFERKPIVLCIYRSNYVYSLVNKPTVLILLARMANLCSTLKWRARGISFLISIPFCLFSRSIIAASSGIWMSEVDATKTPSVAFTEQWTHPLWLLMVLSRLLIQHLNSTHYFKPSLVYFVWLNKTYVHIYRLLYCMKHAWRLVFTGKY